ncbi:MAG: peptidylprolyl isomerase [Anaerolineae bacterium]
MKRSHDAEPRPLTRKQISRREKELRARRMLILGTVAMAILVIGVLAWGLIDQYVLEPRKPAATVNGESITVREYQALYRFRYWTYSNYILQLQANAQQLSGSEEDTSQMIAAVEQQIQQVQSEMAQLPNIVLEQLIEDRLVRQAAEREGITVTDAEIDARLRQEFGFSEEQTGSSETQSDFETVYAEWIAAVTKQAEVSEVDVRKFVAGDLYRFKLEDIIIADVPTTAEQVHARHILVDTEEEAQQALARLKAGESFEAVASDVSVDTYSAQAGGDLGWFPRGAMVPEFEDVAFSTPPGEISDVVASDYGYHIILVEEYDADRELEPYMLTQKQNQAVGEWLQLQRETAEIVRSWDSSYVPEISYAGALGG